MISGRQCVRALNASEGWMTAHAEPVKSRVEVLGARVGLVRRREPPNRASDAMLNVRVASCSACD